MNTPTQSPRTVLEAYIEGTRPSNVALLGDILHEKIEMTGWMGPDFISGGSELFLSVIKRTKSHLTTVPKF